METDSRSRSLARLHDGGVQQGRKSSQADGEMQQVQKSSPADGADGEMQQGQKSSPADGEMQQGQKSSHTDGDVQQGSFMSSTKAIREFFRAHENIGPQNATSISGFDKLDHLKIFPPPGLPTPEEAIVDGMSHMQVDSENSAKVLAGHKRTPAVAAEANVAKKARYVEVPYLPQPGDIFVCQGQQLQVRMFDGKCVLEPAEAGWL